MLQQLVARGPDATGEWHAAGVTLGSTRLVVRDLVHGDQPMVRAPGGRSVAIVYNGEIYNAASLKATLTSLRHRFEGSCDTEVVLTAYLEWGAAFVDRLIGMFALAIWDEHHQRLILARDRLGIKPLYYVRPDDHTLVFASTQRALLAHPRVVAEIDRASLRDALEIIRAPGRAFWAGIYELPPAHVQIVTPQGERWHRYWAMDPCEPSGSPDPEQTGALLQQIVAEHAVADAPAGVLLSGGLDSSLIAALASRLPREGVSPLRTYSLDYTFNLSSASDDSERESADAPFALVVARALGAEHQALTLDTADIADSALRVRANRALDVPSARGDFNTSFLQLCSAARETSTVVMSGEGADELFGGYFWFRGPDSNTDTFPWFGPDDVARGAYLAPEVIASLDRASYRADEYAAAIATAPVKVHDRQSRFRLHQYLHLTRFLPFFLERLDRMSMAVGLEARVPYCDHRLVELVWSGTMPIEPPKGLLVQVAQGAVPASVVQRRKSAYPVTRDPAYELSLRDAVRSLLDDPEAPSRELLDTCALAAAVHGPVPRDTSQESRAGLEFAIALDWWLREHRPRLRSCLRTSP